MKNKFQTGKDGVYILLIFFLLLGSAISKTTAQGYCTTGLYDNDYSCIYNAAINDFSLFDIHQENTGCSGPFSDYTQLTANLALGETYLFTVSSTSSEPSNDFVGIWIDYNDNFSFDDAGELVFASASGGQLSGVFAIPANIPVGNHRMRVRLKSDFSSTPFKLNNSCTFFSLGEAQDYTVHISAAPACKGLVSMEVKDINKFSATVSWGCNGCSGPFIVEYGPVGFIPGKGNSAGINGKIVNADGPSAVLNGLEADHAYEVYVRRNCGPDSYSPNFGPLKFLTLYDACGTLNTISCGQIYTAKLSKGIGEYYYYPNSSGGTGGKELIYAFKPDISGSYVITVAASNNSSATYMIKEASLGCDRYSWRRITQMGYNAPASQLIGTLNAGTTYYLLIDGQENFETIHDFKIECAVSFDPCISINSLNCAAKTDVDLPPGPGAFDFVSGNMFFASGKEKIFSYTAQSNGRLKVTLSADANNNGAAIYIKNANNGCDTSGWTALGYSSYISWPYASNPFTVTSGNTYYIMVDALSLEGCSADMELSCPDSWEPCQSIIPINCGQAVVASIPAGMGKYDYLGSNCGGPGYFEGKELIYSFRALNTGYHEIKISASDNKRVNFMIKDANACNDSGWQCIGLADNAGSLYTNTRLESGKTYYLMLDAIDITSQTSMTISINCDPLSDPCKSISTLACNETLAITLPSGRGGFNPYFSFGPETGTEKIIRFKSPKTGTYFIKTTDYAQGTFSFAIKPESQGCDEFNWKMIDRIYDNRTILIPLQLKADTSYYFLVENSGGFYNDAVFSMEILCQAETTDPCANINNITGCGIPVSAVIGSGIGNFVPCGNGFYYGSGIPGPAGKENIFRFKPLVSGRYLIRSTAGTGEVSFAISDTSAGCNNAVWTCIGNAGGPWAYYPSLLTVPVKLEAGTTYYIMVDANDTTGASHTFEISCPENYDPCQSITTVGCGEYINITNKEGYGNNFRQPCYNNFTASGKEVVFEYTAITNGKIFMEAYGWFSDIMVYFKKSSPVCEEKDWICLGVASRYNYYFFAPYDLVKGEKYQVMFIPVFGNSGQDYIAGNFRINCPVDCKIYADADGDGFGDPDRSFQECYFVDKGYAAVNDDCNDKDSGIHPGAQEICGNNTDDDCDGLVDEGCCIMTVDAGADITSYYGVNPTESITRTIAFNGGTAPYSITWTMSRPLVCNPYNAAGDELFYSGTCINAPCPVNQNNTMPPVCEGNVTLTTRLRDSATICVTVKDAKGCSATDCFVINAIATEAKIYPNPSNKTSVLAFYTEQPSSCNIIIRDLQQRTVQQFGVRSVKGKNQVPLDLGNLSSGVYYVTILWGNDQKVLMLVVL